VCISNLSDPYFIVICGLSGCTMYFSILLNGTIFFSPQLLLETFQEKFGAILLQTYRGKVLAILVRFNKILTVWTYFWKLLTPNCIKMHPVGTELFHTDGHTDMTKLTVDLRNYETAPKIKSKEGGDMYVGRVRGTQLHRCCVFPASCRPLNLNLWSGNPKQELHRY